MTQPQGKDRLGRARHWLRLGNPPRDALDALADVGPGDRATYVALSGREWLASVTGRDGHTADYRFNPSAGRVTIDWFAAPGARPGSGFGRRKVERLARRWRLGGFSEILIEVAAGHWGSKAGMTGYYFWPRVGFAGTMSYAQRRRLPAFYRDALVKKRSLSLADLFVIQGGPEAWKRYGGRLRNLRYDL
jgi:hypothetical protein